MTVQRCPWCGTDPLYCAYHDNEWGVPCHDEQRLFEFLILEGAQAGLSWITVLKKREHYREALEGFDPERIVRFTPARIEKMMQNPGLVRNRLKLESTVRNARAWLTLQDEKGSAAGHVWSFVDHAPIIHQRASMSDVPASTERSDAMSKDLKKRGFNFVGSTICYAYMQAIGMVNDHLVTCHRHPAFSGRAPAA